MLQPIGRCNDRAQWGHFFSSKTFFSRKAFEEKKCCWDGGRLETAVNVRRGVPCSPSSRIQVPINHLVSGKTMIFIFFLGEVARILVIPTIGRRDGKPARLFSEPEPGTTTVSEFGFSAPTPPPRYFLATLFRFSMTATTSRRTRTKSTSSPRFDFLSATHGDTSLCTRSPHRVRPSRRTRFFQAGGT
ncbi:hypothetical protein APED_30885 [Acanthopleuribacter pedis]